MLADHTPSPAIATSDLERARAFYEGTLGFKPVQELPEAGGVTYQAGGGTFLLYKSHFAGTNKATSMGFELSMEAFEDEVAALRAAGITFDTFDVDGISWDGDIAVMGAGRGIWFRDPDGNTIAVSGGSVG